MEIGDVIEYSCGIALVLDVNECRALLLLKDKRRVDSISPSAEVKIIKRAGG